MFPLTTTPTSLEAISPLYYIEAGDGEPVVLLHGMGCDNRTWDPVRAELAEGWRVLTPDLPGHGRSPKPWRTYSLKLYLALLTRWLDGLKLGPVHLVGHSLGGALAMALAMERPDLVRSVGAVCSVRLVDHTPPGQALSAFMRFGMAQLFGPPRPRSTQRFLEQGFGVESAGITPEMIALWQQTADLSTRAVISTNRQLRRPESLLFDRLGQVKAPVWLLYGKRDPLFPGVDLVEQVVSRLPAAKLDLMNCGHLPMFERPEDFLPRLKGHLTRVSQAGNVKELIPSQG